MLKHNDKWRKAGYKRLSSSVQSNSLQPHELQDTRPPCPSPTHGVYSNSCHWVSDAIQPSHPLSSPSPPAFSLSQHQGLFKWVSSSHHVVTMNIQDWSPLRWTGWISLQSKGLPRIFANTTVQKHQFFGAQVSSESNSHIHAWPREKP